MNRPDRRRARTRVITCAAICLALASDIVAAQSVTTIKTDASWGRTAQTLNPNAANTVVAGNRGATYAIPGNVYTITEAQGKLAGSNLFHSFESFSVGSGDAAVFTTTTPTLNNVISRVSGNSPTTINGLLALVPAAGSNPNFFFVNPNGITFGAGAQVDVPAAFHVSTADNLRFADGTVFRAGNGSDSTLTIAPPEAFGFLGNRRGAVRVGEGAGLTAFPGQPLSVSAGDIRVDRASLVTEGMSDIRLTAVGADVLDVPLTGPLPVAHGTLAIVNGAAIVAFTLGSLDSGNIAISAGDIRIDGQHSGPIFTGVSTIAFPGETGHAGNVSVQAAGNLVVVDGGLIASQSYSVGNAGSVTASARNITFDSLGNTNAVDALGFFAQTGMYVCTCVAGSPGSIGSLTLAAAGDVSILNGARILSRSRSSGTAGPITVQAGTMIVDGQVSPLLTGIDSRANGLGDGAPIDVTVAGQLTILSAAAISALTATEGNAGSVRVAAASMYFDSLGSPFITGIYSQTNATSSGNAGNVDVSVAGNLLMRGSEISTDTFASGNAGSIKVKASSLDIDGTHDGGAGSQFTGITSNTRQTSTGNGGHIDVAVNGPISIVSGQITAQSLGQGAAGSISIQAESMTIEAQDFPFAGITAGSLSPQGAGSIEIAVNGTLSLLHGGMVASTTVGAGDAGSIKIKAGDLYMDGRGQFASIQAAAGPTSSGRGGNIEVEVTGDATLLNEAFIIATTAGTGKAGSVKVKAKNLYIDAQNTNGFSIAAVSEGFDSGNAGDVEVSVQEHLSILHTGAISASTLSPSGRAGSVRVEAGTIEISGDSEISAIAYSESSGQTGNVTVKARGSITLSDGGALTIQNDATIHDPNSVLPTLLSVSASEIALVNAQITTQSTGNVQGGDILISAGQITVGQLANITAETFGKGKAGNVTMTADGLAVMSGGRIEASTSGEGNGGSISVTAHNVSLEGMNSGIVAQAKGSSTAGQAGSIEINAMDGLTLRSGGLVSTSTLSSADAGSIKIAAHSVLVSGNASSVSTTTVGAGQGGNILISAAQMTVEQLADITAETSGKGKAGNVTMTVDRLDVQSGGRIEASTSGEGKGGSIAVTVTGDMTVSGVNSNSQTDNRSGLFAKTQSPAGTGGGAGGGTGSGGTAGGGTGGAGTGGGGTGGGSGTTAKPGSAGNIAITAKNLLLDKGAQIDSSTTSGGAGGNVSVTTAENITIAGSTTSLKSDASRGDGQGGSITMVAKNITVGDGASVTAATSGKGDAGNITLTAVDQLLLQSSGKVTTSTSGDGKGGSVVIQAGRVLLDGPDTAIIADTLRPFADLTITLNILHVNDGDLVVQLDSPRGTRVALLSGVGGTGDNFIETKFNDQAAKSITSGSAPFTGTFTAREPLAQLINEPVIVIDDQGPHGWTLNVRDTVTGNIGTLQNWSLQIGQQTFRSGDAPTTIPDKGSALQSTIVPANPILQTVQGTGEAKGIGGDVTINAGSVTVQNGATMSAITRGSGKGGIVDLQVAGDVSVSNNARIATDTFGSGRAGDVHINAQNLLLNLGEVSSNSSGSSSGNAGRVGINLAGTLTLRNSGLISSSTKSILGSAGTIEANAGQIVVDGRGSALLADALAESSGQTGSLMVNATNAITLSNGGILSIRNDATVPDPGALTPTLLSVSAPNITLKDASITAESIGNVAASDIRIHFTGNLMVDPSSITTSANQGNGGAISIGGGSLIVLQDSQITTSVLGGLGNGGDISVQANSLVMKSGFIQANTAGAGASGGNVNINVQTLLPSGNSLFVGGSEPFVFQPGIAGPNVIQAAAPTGVSGTINATSPTLDVAGSLNGLTAKVADFGALGKDLCRAGARSSFTPVGRGGLRPRSAGMIRPEEAPTETAMRQDAIGGPVVIAQMQGATHPGWLAECRY